MNTDIPRVVKALLPELARRMAGYPVTVNILPMYGERVSGKAYKNVMGEVAIDVSSRLDLDNFYTVFLHEIGHIVMKHVTPNSPTPKPWEVDDFVPTAKGEAIITKEIDKRELETNTFVRLMDARITKKSLSKYGSSDTLTKFVTLCEHTKEILK